jgi:hypothetical protein
MPLLPDQDPELLFVAGEIPEIPKEKRYLLKYFRKPLQQAFLQYYLAFGAVRYFEQHTGNTCSKRWLNAMRLKFKKLEAVHAVAKADFDLDKLTLIEKGKYKWKN